MEPERFSVKIVENIDTAGMSFFKDFKYRWVITDTDTDVIQKVGYGFSMLDAQASARRMVDRIVKGKRRIKS